ncbi:AP2/ERF and B3 domain-containing transcription factor At1g51120-like [Euphorbia lathyris]|uniref:AP2/ERF and B3 domain-containing transcription factor At1g51120-like n=1 Tax=Euphorbia lathyris TaxID=212925 RepID=UPI003313BF96
MMGEAVDIISDSVIEDVSDSNCSTRLSLATEHEMHGSNICSSKFRGVVTLPNGRWGSQIYVKYQRNWLGTFNSEKEAAMAYDSAALKLRTEEYGHCNFPVTDVTVKEPNFQSYYSSEDVLNMIRNGSYQLNFANFISFHQQNSTETELLAHNRSQSNRKVTSTQLFEKQLTPSDVGKLNRLVIPKRFAVEFFTDMSAGAEENFAVNMADDVVLTFLDKSMKLWKFRYCYWKSSESYVFTRGWNRFVKEKQLKASDTIVFSLCECWENGTVSETYYMIDILSLSSENSSSSLLELSNESNEAGERKSFRLFGTEIF